VKATTHQLKRKKAIHSVAVSVFIYGTEDESRVFAAIRLIVPENVTVYRQQVAGHFGNAIIILKARIRDAQTIRQVIETIRNKLPKRDRIHFQERIHQHLSEKCTLVMKFDKQSAARGTLTPGEDDPIVVRVKIAAYPARPETAAEIARDLLNNA
jgi:RNA binding exosome subunit